RAETGRGVAGPTGVSRCRLRCHSQREAFPGPFSARRSRACAKRTTDWNRQPRGKTVKLKHDRLQNLTADIFGAAGCGVEEAERIAVHLVEANLVGHDSHGVIR